MKTSEDAGHRHKWFKGNVFTTINDGHRHKISARLMKALSARRPFASRNHTHKLLKR